MALQRLCFCLGLVLLAGCASQGERVIHEVAGQWSVRLYTERSFALGERSHYRVYHRGQLVRLAPPLVRRATSELLAVGHFNAGVFPYPDLIVLVHDRYTDERGYGAAQVRAFQLIGQAHGFEAQPISPQPLP
jgi:hypothetical protein